MEYKIIGNVVPAVDINLKKGEKVYTQSGGMTWKTEGIEMKTDTGGGIKKVLGRVFSGEGIFVNHYEATIEGATVGFSSTMPGKIVPLQINPNNGIYTQKGAFLCAQEGVELSVTLTKKLSAGFFGGEGLILQELSGTGMAFLEADGDIYEKTLAQGEVFYVNTGNLVCFDKTCDYSVEIVKGAKNLIFGNEGLFFIKLTGPGKVIIQTQNFYEFASKILSQGPSSVIHSDGDTGKTDITIPLFRK